MGRMSLRAAAGLAGFGGRAGFGEQRLGGQLRVSVDRQARLTRNSLPARPRRLGARVWQWPPSAQAAARGAL